MSKGDFANLCINVVRIIDETKLSARELGCLVSLLTLASERFLLSCHKEKEGSDAKS